MRIEQLEVTQNKRQNAWQQFQSAKGKSKKVRIMKSSILWNIKCVHRIPTVIRENPETKGCF